MSGREDMVVVIDVFLKIGSDVNVKIIIDEDIVLYFVIKYVVFCLVFQICLMILEYNLDFDIRNRVRVIKFLKLGFDI